MSVITFDTHKLVKELSTKGFSSDQAEGIKDALQRALIVGEMARSRDIRHLEAEMKQMELRLTMKIGTLILAGIGFMTVMHKMS